MIRYVPGIEWSREKYNELNLQQNPLLTFLYVAPMGEVIVSDEPFRKKEMRKGIDIFFKMTDAEFITFAEHEHPESYLKGFCSLGFTPSKMGERNSAFQQVGNIVWFLTRRQFYYKRVGTSGSSKPQRDKECKSL